MKSDEPTRMPLSGDEPSETIVFDVSLRHTEAADRPHVDMARAVMIEFAEGYATSRAPTEDIVLAPVGSAFLSVLNLPRAAPPYLSDGENGTTVLMTMGYLRKAMQAARDPKQAVSAYLDGFRLGCRAFLQSLSSGNPFELLPAEPSLFSESASRLLMVRFTMHEVQASNRFTLPSPDKNDVERAFERWETSILRIQVAGYLQSRKHSHLNAEQAFSRIFVTTERLWVTMTEVAALSVGRPGLPLCLRTSQTWQQHVAPFWSDFTSALGLLPPDIPNQWQVDAARMALEPVLSRWLTHLLAKIGLNLHLDEISWRPHP